MPIRGGNLHANGWNYSSSLTLGDFPSPFVNCAGQAACVSISGQAPGDSCPSGV